METQTGTFLWWVLGAGLFMMLTKCYTYMKAYVRSVWVVSRLPGPFAWPVIGHAHWVVDSKRLVRASVDFPRKYGLIFRAWLSVFPIVFLVDPRHIQKVLSSSKHVEKTNYLYVMMHNFLGTGLITSEGMRWKLHRRLMLPSFSLSILEEFVGVFAKGGDYLVKMLEEKANGRKIALNVNAFINKTVFSILTEAILGVPIDSSLSAVFQKESPYRKASPTLQYRLLRPWLLLPSVFNVTDIATNEMQHKKALFQFTKEAIEKRKQQVTVKDCREKCFLDYLLAIVADNPDAFTEDDCVHEACTLMLAGQDSVGAALAFTMHLLANHPRQQEKAVAEQDLIFEGSTRPLELTDLRRMTYLEQCIKEALRLYPSVPVFSRTLGEDLPLGKWTLPKGCNVFISPFITHRLSEIYPNPETFHPERFAVGELEKRPACSYLPFSAGPRNCIGYKFAELEMKAVLSSVLRHFVLSPVEGKETVTLSYRITLRASGGLWVNLTPRTSSETHQPQETQE